MKRSQQATGGAEAIAVRAEATRNALVAAARRLFVEKGYHATSTEEIVIAAEVGTRGALYHHFEGKQALFRAVFELVEEDLLSAAPRPAESTDALTLLREGLIGFLHASVTPEVQRIILIDGPAVLGWQEWRALEERYGLGTIRSLLELAMSAGSLRKQPIDALAHILLAAIDEAALFVANASNPDTAKEEAVAVVDQLLSGLTSPT
ncbi:MAG: TetR family transcriptional regulator [Rhodococcus sp. (in: high G+C Gram-positive bacteria)]|uniref:TetR/AcrR family transcriptional regulator n=1 Tax=Rhodococcus sp. TaxID=1831 RepID=UPI003BAF18FB